MIKYSKKIWHKVSKKLGQSVISYLMVIILITKFLGFLKLRIIAANFGASKELDIFWTAFTIPDIMFDVLISGSINAAIIPIFTSTRHKDGDKELVDLFMDINILLAFVFTIIGVLIFIFSYDISNFLIRGRQIRDVLNIASNITVEDVDMLARMTRIVVLCPIILGISTIISGYLVTYKKFFISNITPLIYNVVIVFLTLIFVKQFDLGVYGLSYAILLGTISQLLVQLPTLFKLMRRYGGKGLLQDLMNFADYKWHRIKRIIKLAAPRSTGVLFQELNTIFNKMIGFTITEGAISAYSYAYSLHLFPVHIITGSMAQVALTNFSELFCQNRLDEFKDTFNEVLQLAFYLIMPFLAFLVVLRLPIVRLAYGTGNFNWWDTKFTSWSLALLSLGMVAQVGSSLTLRAYYAIGETRIPLITSIVKIFVNVILTYYFTNFFSHYTDWRPIVSQVINQIRGGHATNSVSLVVQSLGSDLITWFTTRNDFDYAIGGIALAFSVSFLLELILDLSLLNRKVKGIVNWKRTWWPLIIKFLMAISTIVPMYVFYRWLDLNVLDTTRVINVILIFIYTTFLGGVIYLGLSWIFALQEFIYLKDRLQELALNFIGREKVDN